MKNTTEFKTRFYFSFVLYIFFLSNAAFAEHLPNPDKLEFKTAFEKTVYKNFYLKHKSSSALKFSKKNNMISMEDHYTLFFDTDKNKQIQRVYRILEIDGWQSIANKPDNLNLWLGQLFYRIDAGDFAAVYDLLFFENIELEIGGLKTKTRIISQLMEANNSFIIPEKITRQKLAKQQIVKIYLQTSETLLIKLPLVLFIDHEIDVLQDDLFKKITAFVNSKEGVGFKSLHDLPEIFPGSSIKGNLLNIPFPDLDSIKVPNLEFGIQNKIINRVKINLTQNTENSIIFNKIYLIDYYLQPGLLKIKNLQSLLENIYLLLLPAKFSPYPNHPSGKIIFHGYNKEELAIRGNMDWLQLKSSLYDEGPLYFFPIQIDENDNDVAIKGLMYIFKTQSAQYYHFADLDLKFDKNTSAKAPHFTMHLYPFAKRE